MNNKQIAQRALSLLDLTSLNDDDCDEVIKSLCERASTEYGSVAAVCVWPKFVAQAVDLLQGTDIKVAAVANFPEGYPDPEKPKKETMQIIAAGGTEVDVVFPWRNLLDGDVESGSEVVSGCKSRCGNNVTLKVILESGELADEALIYKAARIAIDSGADFIKTSTGKTARSASLPAAKAMLRAIADSGMPCGLKVSGGVKTIEAANAYMSLADDIMGEAWVSPKTFRIGASGLLDTLVQELKS